MATRNSTGVLAYKEDATKQRLGSLTEDLALLAPRTSTVQWAPRDLT